MPKTNPESAEPTGGTTSVTVADYDEPVAPSTSTEPELGKRSDLAPLSIRTSAAPSHTSRRLFLSRHQVADLLGRYGLLRACMGRDCSGEGFGDIAEPNPRPWGRPVATCERREKLGSSRICA